MTAKEWLEKEEWDNLAVDSQKWSHYTMMDKIMEEYAKVYLKIKNLPIRFTIRRRYKLLFITSKSLKGFLFTLLPTLKSFTLLL